MATRDERKALMRDLSNSFRKYFYYTEIDGKKQKVTIDRRKLHSNQHATKNFNDKDIEAYFKKKCPKLGPDTPTTVTIEIQEMDTAEAGLALKKEGFAPCILNMASDRYPGGGAWRGANAQEESLYRRSSLFLSLEKSKAKYPIPEFGAIYSPDVMFIKNFKEKYIPEAYYLSVISMSMIRRPSLRKNRTLESKMFKIAYTKILHLLTVALMNGHDSIVLGAWGCGAYRCPPHEIAKIFKSVINNYFRNKFKKIVFAILEDHNSRGMNGEIFTGILSPIKKSED